MKEHAVVLPTSAGPVGGLVSEPQGEQRAALILLGGHGPSGRAGVNAIWSRLARDLAALGVVVLRFDLTGECESTLVGTGAERIEGWKRNTNLAVLREVAPWFLREAGEQELLLAGTCHGARVALEFAAGDASVRALFMVAPYLWLREPGQRDAPPHAAKLPPEPAWANGPTLNSEAEILDAFRAIRARASVWVLVGDGEAEPVEAVLGSLGNGGRPVELEIASGMPIHPVAHPRQQATVRRRLRARVSRALIGRSAEWDRAATV